MYPRDIRCYPRDILVYPVGNSYPVGNAYIPWVYPSIPWVPTTYPVGNVMSWVTSRGQHHISREFKIYPVGDIDIPWIHIPWGIYNYPVDDIPWTTPIIPWVTSISRGCTPVGDIPLSCGRHHVQIVTKKVCKLVYKNVFNGKLRIIERGYVIVCEPHIFAK